MPSGRRDFLAELFAVGALPAVGGVKPAALLQQAAASVPAVGQDKASLDFWSEFFDYRTTAAEWPSATRGLGGSNRAAGPSTSDREPFFFHAASQGLRPAIDIPASELLPGGDVQVTVNVVAFRPSDEDRASFEKLQSAQLRLDLVQERPVLDILDTLAWTSIAALHPDRANKLPALENLAFDPGASNQRLKNMVLPGGEGSWAVNLVAQKRESALSRFLSVITGEVDRFAPALGLPLISKGALAAFNRVYGALHEDAEPVFRMNPIQVYATSAAMGGMVSRGLPLRTGTYVLVPNQHVARLTPAQVDGMELRQGLLVPKNTPSMSIAEVAKTTLREITYTTIDVSVRPAQLANCGGGGSQRGGQQGATEADPPSRGATPSAGSGRGSSTGSGQGRQGTSTGSGQGGGRSAR